MGVAAKNRRISILRAVIEENDAGEEIASRWSEWLTVWASYHPVSDAEKVRAAAVERRTDARFVIRWFPARVEISGEHHLRFDGHDWQIVGIKEVGLREELEITAWRWKKN